MCSLENSGIDGLGMEVWAITAQIGKDVRNIAMSERTTRSIDRLNKGLPVAGHLLRFLFAAYLILSC